MAMSMSVSTRLSLMAILACPFVIGCGWASLANDQAIGQPCDLSVDAGEYQSVYNASAEGCPSNVCLKPAFGNESPPPIPPTGPTCSGECTQDSDCEGELRDVNIPSDTRCASGFSCATPFVVGPLCCKKMCVCKDFIPPAGLANAALCTDVARDGGVCPASPPGVVGVEEMIDTQLHVSPTRKVDIVTMIDNSPSMGPKIEKFQAAFPKLIEALKDPNEGNLPDLRIAILDSDLGVRDAHATGSCGPKMLPDGTISLVGDMGRFQMRTSPLACSILPTSLFLEHKAGAPVNYAGDISSVFSCLVGNLGTNGCGYEHQLGAVEMAFFAADAPNAAAQAMFLRPDAQLGLIFLTDEDDCSAAPDYSMFSDSPELQGETRSLRCATRAHRCGGNNLTSPPPGYPTVASFSHPFSDCQARTDACSPSSSSSSQGASDASVQTDCSPLRSVSQLAAEIRSLKLAPEQLVVAGIFGWPRSAADMVTAEYKIAPVPNPNPSDTANPTIFDYWPVCYDPNHLPSPATTDPATGFDPVAAAWGAPGGLRAAAFVDEFGANGMKLSICEPDLSATMESIGNALVSRCPSPWTNMCFDYKLVDIDPAMPGVQADCRVVFRTPTVVGDQMIYVESTDPILQCSPGATSDTVTATCWQIIADPNRCTATGQRITLVRPAADKAARPQLQAGTKLRMQCRACPAGSTATTGCEY